MSGKTLYDKLWDAHRVREDRDGTCLIYIDRHLVHEVTSPQAFEGLRQQLAADPIFAGEDGGSVDTVMERLQAAPSTYEELLADAGVDVLVLEPRPGGRDDIAVLPADGLL